MAKLGSWQADREHRAAVRGVARDDFAAVRLDDLPANGQAQPDAGVLRAHVGFEDLVAQILRESPGPLSGDRDR